MKNYLEVVGTCPICEKKVIFRSNHEWLRDHFLCTNCGSIPRERALMQAIKMYYPDYQNLVIHESSPIGRGASVKFKNECPNYSTSHFYLDIPLGEYHPEHMHRCENLEDLTFEDEKFNLFITQDVMEHIFGPEKAFKEIARVLKPGGAHIFSVPIVNKNKKTERWACQNEDKTVKFFHDPEYHGNPIDEQGSPVAMHWGYDISELIQQEAGTPTTIVMIDNIEMGIRAEYIEILVSRKPLSSS